MIKRTFQNEQDYINFVETAGIFTHLRAYNAACNIWKKEDQPFVSKVRNKEYQKEHFEEWKKCIDIWTKAEKEYGEELAFWREIYENQGIENLFYAFGFIYRSEEDGFSCIEDDINVKVSELERHGDYPTTFPCVMCLEADLDSRGLNIVFVYPEDFKEPSPKLDFGWLKENTKEFWGII